jgi:hypothetical protein
MIIPLMTAIHASRGGMAAGATGQVKSRLRLVPLLETILATEFLHPSCCIHKFLLPSEKGVAVGADFNADLFSRAADLKLASAGTANLCLMTWRMDTLLHPSGSPLSCNATAMGNFAKRLAVAVPSLF